MNTHTTHTPDTPSTVSRRAVDRTAVGVAIALHLAIAVFPLSASGLVAPAWFLALVAVGWMAGAVAVWRLRRSAPRRAWLVPVATIVVWVGLLTLGEQVLGWTA